MSEEEIFTKLRDAIVERDKNAVEKVCREVIEKGIDPLKAIEKGIMEGAKIIGEKFDKLEIFLMDLMLAADAMKAGVEILLSKVPREAAPRKGVIVIGTVSGDIHDIGKNIVASLLSANGFTVYDLGVDVSPVKFVEEAEKVNADVIAMSALMTSTVGVQKDVIDYLRDMGKRDKFLIVVGGGATTKEWAEEIGADGWAETATEGVKVISKLIEERKT